MTNVLDNAAVNKQLGLTYRLQLRPENSQIGFRDKNLKLMPGIAEVKTGHRRIVEFFVGPLLQHKQESLSER